MIYPIRYIKITQYPHKNNDLSIDFFNKLNWYYTTFFSLWKDLYSQSISQTWKNAANMI